MHKICFAINYHFEMLMHIMLDIWTYKAHTRKKFLVMLKFLIISLLV